jgi:dTDP-4-dehydrorhamnose reductase
MPNYRLWQKSWKFFPIKPKLMNPIPSILLLGRHGQVAWELQRTLHSIGHVTILGSADLDLANGEQIRAMVRQLRPQIVVNAAAYTAVDKAESDVEMARSINSIAPQILAEEAKQLGALLVHYSTDYIFDGQKNNAYSEEDATNPLGVYGQTKLEGEQSIQLIGCDHLILRTTWVYGMRGKNFLLTILRLAAERPELKIVADQIGAPTWSRSIATVTGQILSQWAHNPAPGIYHLSGGGATSWHGFAEKIVDYSRQQDPHRKLVVEKILPIGTSDYPTPAQRPANSCLDNSKLRRTFGLGLPNWSQDLALAMIPD